MANPKPPTHEEAWQIIQLEFAGSMANYNALHAYIRAAEQTERERDELKAKLKKSLADGEATGLLRAAGRVAELALVEFECRDKFARGLDRYYFHEAAGEALDNAAQKLKAAAKAVAEVIK